MPALTLWYSPGSVAMATHIALEEAQADFTLRRVDFSAAEQQSDDYLKLNPKGRVPLLQTPQGDLTEVLAILDYVASTHPQAGLMPTDPFDRARALSFMGYLASTVHVAHAHKQRGSRWADDPAAWDAMRDKVTQNMSDCMALIQDRLVTGPWVLGDAYSLCDAYLFTIARWLPADGVAREEFPFVAVHWDAMLKRPAVQRTLPSHP